MIGEFWRRLAQNRLLDVAAVALVTICVVQLSRVVPGRANQDDFARYYISGHLLMEGRNPYTVELVPLYASHGFVLPPGVQIIRSTYPPLAVWLFALLAEFTPGAGFACWVTVEICSLAIILWQTKRLLGQRLTKRSDLFVCAAALTSAPVYWHFIYSQIGLLLAALVLMAYAWHVEGKDTGACIAITIAGLMKVFPLVLLPWFLWRSEGSIRRRAVRAAVVAAVALLVVLITGIPLWLDYVRYILPWLPTDSMGAYNVTFAAYVAKLGVIASGVSPLSDDARPWITAGCCVGLALIGLCYAMCLWTRSDPETEFCLLCAAMLAGSIMTWVHGLVFLIFPMAVLGVRIARHPSWRGIILLSVILLLLNNVITREGPFLDSHRFLKITVNDLPMFGLLGVVAFFAGQLRGSRPQ
ncbi:MAG TPA: glycosyltransferase family 87 protein [Verrucomicrobiae bacterium]|nr:glycosyltransferase family 87 protein [Verrucomicrobiae bacterium]